MTGYQSHSDYLDVNITDTEDDNQCGNTYVVDSGSRKITIVQGVSQHEFATNYANIINGEMLK